MIDHTLDTHNKSCSSVSARCCQLGRNGLGQSFKVKKAVLLFQADIENPVPVIYIEREA